MTRSANAELTQLLNAVAAVAVKVKEDEVRLQ